MRCRTRASCNGVVHTGRKRGAYGAEGVHERARGKDGDGEREREREKRGRQGDGPCVCTTRRVYQATSVVTAIVPTTSRTQAGIRVLSVYPLLLSVAPFFRSPASLSGSLRASSPSTPSGTRFTARRGRSLLPLVLFSLFIRNLRNRLVLLISFPFSRSLFRSFLLSCHSFPSSSCSMIP